jgi:hypothetical protein
MKLENDVSHTDNNHGGKSMGVQEERNVVASRNGPKKGVGFRGTDFIFSSFS